MRPGLVVVLALLATPVSGCESFLMGEYESQGPPDSPPSRRIGPQPPHGDEEGPESPSSTFEEVPSEPTTPPPPPPPTDDDGDGWSTPEDCDDQDPTVHPQAPEVCDGIDSDCVPTPLERDLDGDGWMICDGDCDEYAPDTHPGAAEVCGGGDEDCDGEYDELPDGDGDGFAGCEDCDDLDPNVYDEAPEICDGVTNDCQSTSPADSDIDTDGFGPCDGDCDEGNTAASDTIHPGAPELCDGVDNDCDGLVDDEADADGDGFTLCGPDLILGTPDDDCMDGDAATFPGAVETCDGVDDDCDAVADEGFDGDGDGVTICGADGLLGTLDDDCDDLDPARRPGLPDLAGDGVDSDCDGADAPAGGTALAGTPSELRDWAVAMVSALRGSGPTSPLPGAGCVASPTTAEPPPAGASAAPGNPWTWSGSWTTCPDTGGGFEGSLDYYDFTSQSCCSCSTTTTASGTWFDVPFARAGGLTVSGTGWALTADYSGTWGGACAGSAGTSDDIDLGGDLVIHRTPAAPAYLGAPTGLSTMQWSRVHESDTWSLSLGPTTNETLDIAVEAQLNTAPRTLWGSLTWSAIGPDEYGDIIGCALEPTGGAVVVTVDAPMPGEPSALIISPDGVCDGCLSWSVDGVDQGSFCPLDLAL